MDDIIRREFEVAVGEVFVGAKSQPTRAWVDSMGPHLFVRACFSTRVSKDAMRRLSALRDYMRAIAGGEWTAVAYREDHRWDAIEVLTEKLRKRGNLTP